MMLEEANGRLRESQISAEQLDALSTLYILLDLEKDDFCKIIDAVGTDTLLKKQKHYERLSRAEQELAAKERYIKAKIQLEELESEKYQLEEIINHYKEKNSI